MEKDTKITHEELRLAWRNWLYFHRGIDCDETEERFYAYCHSLEQSFVDDILDWDEHTDQPIIVAADTARNIRQCASIHFDAILNAYYVTHPWKQVGY